jgi:hypothetical protein
MEKNKRKNGGERTLERRCGESERREENGSLEFLGSVGSETVVGGVGVGIGFGYEDCGCRVS